MDWFLFDIQVFKKIYSIYYRGNTKQFSNKIKFMIMIMINKIMRHFTDLVLSNTCNISITGEKNACKQIMADNNIVESKFSI